jgi:hypothetical protein
MNVNQYLKKKHAICERLKKAREEAGYKSARAFALTHNIFPRIYQRHEAAQIDFRLSSLINYCQLLNISYLWLICGLTEYKHKPFSDPEIEKI